MKVKELLKQEKGKFNEYYLYYEEYKKWIPFDHLVGLDEYEVEVKEWFYKTATWNNKTYKNLIIVWVK